MLYGNSPEGTGINSSMRFLRRPAAQFWIIAILCALLVLAGCEISPRRIVVSGPSPTPTPTVTGTPTPGISPSPSPTPIPTLTPIPTPTPIGMATQVPRGDAPAQFLFAVSPDSPLMNGFRINGDGSLAPVPGAPFATSAPMHAAVSVHNTLIVASEAAIHAFAVDKETGSIQQTDAVKIGGISKLTTGRSLDVVVATTQSGAVVLWISNGKLKALPERLAASELAPAKTETSPLAVLDASGRFMYVANSTKGEVAAFQVENGRPMPLSPPAYPIIHGAAAVALVKPDQ